MNPRFRRPPRPIPGLASNQRYQARRRPTSLQASGVPLLPIVPGIQLASTDLSCRDAPSNDEPARPCQPPRTRNDPDQAAGTGRRNQRQPTLPPLACILWFGDITGRRRSIGHRTISAVNLQQETNLIRMRSLISRLTHREPNRRTKYNSNHGTDN